jgi:hypothetical protein
LNNGFEVSTIYLGWATDRRDSVNKKAEYDSHRDSPEEDFVKTRGALLKSCVPAEIYFSNQGRFRTTYPIYVED